MQSLYDKLKPNSPQYGLGALTQALGPFEQLLTERRDRRVRQEDKKNQEQAFKAAGYSPDVAKALVDMEPQDRQYVLKGLAERGFGGGFSENTGLGSLLQQAPQGMEMLQGMTGNGGASQNPFYQSGLQGNASNIEIPSLLQGGTEQQLMRKPRTIQEALSLPTKNEQRENEKLRLQQEKLNTQKEHFERKFNREEQSEINKETKAAYDNLVKEYKSAQNNNKRLDKMQQLNENGDLGNATKNQLIQMFGEGILGPHGPKIDIQRWLTGDAAEFEKLSNDFLKDAKEIFGSRLTDFDVKSFLKTVPTLYQSYEGRKRVINNLKNFNKAAEIRFNAGKDIIKENGGKRPQHFELLIEERTKDALDELAKEFAQGSRPTAKKVSGAKFTAPVF